MNSRDLSKFWNVHAAGALDFLIPQDRSWNQETHGLVTCLGPGTHLAASFPRRQATRSLWTLATLAYLWWQEKNINKGYQRRYHAKETIQQDDHALLLAAAAVQRNFTACTALHAAAKDDAEVAEQRDIVLKSWLKGKEHPALMSKQKWSIQALKLFVNLLPIEILW